MGKTTITQTQVRSDTLTGSSINDFVGIYDETDDYVVGNQVYWNRYVWECVNTVSAGTAGDLTNPPDLSSDWERAPFAPALVSTSADYGAAETWLFDIIEIDTSSGDITLTLPLPAIIATWSEGRCFIVFNVGTHTVDFDPNGNTISGSAAALSLPSENGWIEVIKVDDELVLFSNSEAKNDTDIRARSWMGF